MHAIGVNAVKLYVIKLEPKGITYILYKENLFN